MKKHIDKFGVLLLALLLMLSFLAACSDNGSKKTSEDALDTAETAEEAVTDETAAVRIEPNLPKMDFNGKIYKVLGATHSTYSQFINFEIDADGTNGDIVNDAVYNRNLILEEKYNCVIEQDLHENQDDILKKSIASGEDIYSLAFSRLGNVGAMTVAGDFLDLNKMKYLDFTQPWWSLEVTNSLSVAGKLYFTTGDFNLMDKNRTYLLFYNKDMAKSYQMEAFYNYVYDNKWTVDKMTELASAVKADLDGDGVMTDKDRWGLGMDSRNAFYVYIVGCDNFIITKDAADMPVLSVNNEHTIQSVDKVLMLANDRTMAFYCEDFSGKVNYDFWSVVGNVFTEGNSLFAALFTQSLKYMSSNADFDYGILPYPKFDERQEKYISTPDPAWTTVLCIPVTVQDTDFASFMLEAICAASKYEVLPAYYETSSKVKYMYDAESPKMFDIIFSGLRYDLAIPYNWGGVSAIFRGEIPNAGVNNFSSKYAAIEGKALSEMQKTVDMILELG